MGREEKTRRPCKLVLLFVDFSSFICLGWLKLREWLRLHTIDLIRKPILFLYSFLLQGKPSAVSHDGAHSQVQVHTP